MQHTPPPSDNLLRALTRRYFFKQSAIGIGAAALGSLLASITRLGRHARDQSAVAQAAHVPGQGQEHHLSLHGRRPSQLDLFDYKPTLQKYDGQNVPAGIDEGPALRLHQGHAEAARLAVQVRAAAGNSGAQISELLPHLRTVADDITVVRSMHTNQFNHAPGADLHEHRLPAHRAAQHGLVDDLRPGQREPGPARLRRPASPARTSPTAARPAGAAASCPPSTRASSSARRAIRCCSSPIPMACRSRRGASRSTLLKDFNEAAAQRGRRPGDRHAHQPLRDGLPHADPACPTWWTSPRSRAPSTSCTAPSRARSRSPTTACWPAGWSSAACASCSSITGAGTTTARPATTTS